MRVVPIESRRTINSLTAAQSNPCTYARVCMRSVTHSLSVGHGQVESDTQRETYTEILSNNRNWRSYL